MQESSTGDAALGRAAESLQQLLQVLKRGIDDDTPLPTPRCNSLQNQALVPKLPVSCRSRINDGPLFALELDTTMNTATTTFDTTANSMVSSARSESFTTLDAERSRSQEMSSCSSKIDPTLMSRGEDQTANAAQDVCIQAHSDDHGRAVGPPLCIQAAQLTQAYDICNERTIRSTPDSAVQAMDNSPPIICNATLLESEPFLKEALVKDRVSHRDEDVCAKVCFWLLREMLLSPRLNVQDFADEISRVRTFMETHFFTDDRPHCEIDLEALSPSFGCDVADWQQRCQRQEQELAVLREQHAIEMTQLKAQLQQAQHDNAELRQHNAQSSQELIQLKAQLQQVQSELAARHL